MKWIRFFDPRVSSRDDNLSDSLEVIIFPSELEPLSATHILLSKLRIFLLAKGRSVTKIYPPCKDDLKTMSSPRDRKGISVLPRRYIRLFRVFRNYRSIISSEYSESFADRLFRAVAFSIEGLSIPPVYNFRSNVKSSRSRIIVVATIGFEIISCSYLDERTETGPRRSLPHRAAIVIRQEHVVVRYGTIEGYDQTAAWLSSGHSE